PYDRIALIIEPFPHKVYHGMWRVLVELHAMSFFKPRNVAGELNSGKLHAEADAEKGNPVFARIANRLDFALHPAIAEAARHQKPVGPYDQFLPAIFFHIFRIHIIKIKLYSVGSGPVHESFIEALVRFLEV